jgi:hypothetical protein
MQGSFLLDDRNRGCLPEVKQQIVDMSLNASGVRDTARVLHISTDTVPNELKKNEAALESVNTVLLHTLNPDDMVVDVERASEAEMDEMWSFVGKKREPRWLWHTIDHLSLSRLSCTCTQGLANRELRHKRWRPRCLLASEARQA